MVEYPVFRIDLDPPYISNDDYLWVDPSEGEIIHCREGSFYQNLVLPKINYDGEPDDPEIVYSMDYRNVRAAMFLDLESTGARLKFLRVGAVHSGGIFDYFEFDSNIPEVGAYRWDGNARTELSWISDQKRLVNWSKTRGNGVARLDKEISKPFNLYNADTKISYFSARVVPYNLMPLIQASTDNRFVSNRTLSIDTQAIINPGNVYELIEKGKKILEGNKGTSALDFCDDLQKTFSQMMPMHVRVL